MPINQASPPQMTGNLDRAGSRSSCPKALMMIALLASCSDNYHGPMVTHSDSAGIRIATAAPVAAWPAHGALSNAPARAFGGTASDAQHELGNGYWVPVARTSHDSLVVGDGTRLVLFGPDGNVADIIGRMGDGPGEFRDIRTICAGRGDTLLIVDDGRRVATLYDLPSRAVIRQFPTVNEVPPDACSSSLAILVPGLQNIGMPANHPSSRFGRVNSVGDTIAAYPSLPLAYYGKYEAEPSYAFRIDSLFVTDGQAVEVRVYSPGGILSRIVRVAGQPGDAELGDRGGIRGGEASAKGSPAPLRAEPSRPSRSYSEFKLGSDGRLWLLNGIDGATQKSWVAMAADGQPLGTLTLPKRSGEFRILRFWGDTVIVVEDLPAGQRQLSEYVIEWSQPKG